MDQRNIRLTELFSKYLENNITEMETVEFSGYVEDPVYSNELHELLSEAFKNQTDDMGLTEAGRERILQSVLGAGYSIGITHRLRLWPKVVAAAAAVATITLGLWFFNTRNPDLKPQNIVYKNDIAPGKNSATLTLSNGKTISLSDVKTGVVIGKDIKYNDSSTLSSVQHGYLIASTPRGGTYQVTLPDRTRIWLNAATKIKFPSKFIGKERRIILTGEAYLEVAKDKKHPFIVQTDQQEVTVLGTHFNISAYSNEAAVKTTLLEGSVRISQVVAQARGKLVKTKNDVILKPNQQAVLNGNTIDVSDVEAINAIAWKNGEFNFNSETLAQIMRKVERWYNVEVSYNKELAEMKFTGSISRYNHISKLLDLMASTEEIRFEIEGRKITVLQK